MLGFPAIVTVPMTAFGADMEPTVGFEQSDEFPDLHRATLANDAAASMLRPNKTKLTGYPPPSATTRTRRLAGGESG